MKMTKCHHVLLEALENRQFFSTYYVSPTGSDSASGSITAPFATLQNSMKSLEPGDTLNVEPGTYVGFISGWDSQPAGSTGDAYGDIDGTAGKPITIQAAPGSAPGSVIIDSRDNKTPCGIDFEPGCNYINIEGLTVTDGDGSISDYGIKVGGDNFNILNNTVYDVGKTGIFTGFASDSLIQGNTSYDNGEHGFYISNSPSNDQIIGNTSYDNANSGIEVNADVSQGGVGIATNLLIADNVIYGNGATGGGALNFDGLQDSTVENNLLYNNQASGIVLYYADAAAGSIDNLIVNNTVVQAAGARPALNNNSSSSGNIFFNNIFLGNMLVDATSTPALFSNNILLSGYSNQGSYAFSGITSTAKALFANASGTFNLPTDYELSATSPAAGIGVASIAGSLAPTTDILGQPFANDVGAYQNIGQSIAPTLTSFTINDGSVQRSIVTSLTLVFSESVTLSSGAITLEGSGIGGGTQSAQTFTMTNPSNDQKTYVLTFAGGGSLPNGNYQLVVNAALVHSLAGVAMTGGNQTFTFWRLYGDFTGSGAVDLTDLLNLLNAYGATTGQADYAADMDSNGDGAINITDLLTFLNDYGMSATTTGSVTEDAVTNSGDVAATASGSSVHPHEGRHGFWVGN